MSTTAAQMSSAVVLDPRQMFPKEPVGTFPCSSSSSSEDEADTRSTEVPAQTGGHEPVPRSSPSPVSTPERPSATTAAGPQEYGPPLEAIRRMQSQYNKSLQVAEEQMAQMVSPTTRRLTRLDVEVQPAKQLNIAGYGGMVSSSAPVVSDGEDDEEEDAEEEEEGSQDDDLDDEGGTAAEPLDGLIGTCLPGTPSKQGRASEISNADSSPTVSAESSPTKAATKSTTGSSAAPVEAGDDAFLAIQNKRYESMQTLGEMAVPGSSKPPALPAPPPIKTIEIATEAPRPTTGKGYFSFILSAASASNEAAVADRQHHHHHPREKQLLLCNGEHQGIPEEVGKEDEDEDSTSSDQVVAPLSPASPDELMDVDEDDGSDCSGFSDLDHASTSSPIGAGAVVTTTAIVPVTPASKDELMDVDDYSDSDLDPDDDTTSAITSGKINMTNGVDSGVTWRDDSKKHHVQPHQFHRTRGNIAFRAPKFFRDGPDLAASTPAPATDVGGSSTKLSTIASPLSPDSVDIPSPSSKYTLAVMSSSTAATAAAVSSDIAKEGGDVDHDFPSPLNDPTCIEANSSRDGNKKGKKSWKKSLGKKLRITRKKKKGGSSSSGGSSTADDTAEPSPEGYAQPPTQNQSEYGNNPYDELYSDDDEEDGLACPEDLEMPGLHVVPAATSTALVVASSSVDDEVVYKEHQKRPDLDKFRHPEASQKKMAPFAMWYDGEEDLVVNGRGDESVLTDDDAPTEENALALAPSPSNKSQSVTKMLAAFLSRNGSKCASAAAVVYDTDDDSSDGADNNDDASVGSRVGISRPTGCLYDEEEDAYGGGRDGVMEEGTDHFLNNFMSGPLQGYMTGMDPNAVDKEVKAIGRTVHKHTSQSAASPVRVMSRRQYDACGRHTTTYSTASLVEKGVDMVGAGGTTMKVYLLEGTGSGGAKANGTSESATKVQQTHMPSPADETHPPTREEVAKSKAGTGASSLQEAAAAAQAAQPSNAPPIPKPNRKTSNSILMSSLAYSALLNEDTIYDDDDEAGPNSSAVVEYNAPLRTPSSALVLFGTGNERALAVRGSTSTRNAGPAAPNTRAVTVSSERAITVVTEGLPSHAPTNKIFVLLLQPRMRLFELVQLVYYPSVATIGDLVDLIPNNATEQLLGHQAYVGLCRPNSEGSAASILTDLDLMASGAVDGGSANIYRGEILVAIPEGYSGEQCQRYAKPILANQEFSKLLARSDPLAPNTEKN